MCVSHSVVFNSLWSHGLHQALLSMEFSRQEEGCHSPLQRIFLTRGLNRISCIAGSKFPFNEGIQEVVNRERRFGSNLWLLRMLLIIEEGSCFSDSKKVWSLVLFLAKMRSVRIEKKINFDCIYVLVLQRTKYFILCWLQKSFCLCCNPHGKSGPLHTNPCLFKRTSLALPKWNKQNFKDCSNPTELSLPFERSLLAMQIQSYLHRW